MHAAMSPDNMYLRFFSMSPSAAEQEAKRVCREPDSDHAALLAWQDGRLVGVGAYELSGKPGVAEVAFAVPDDMHGRGIASLLLEHLVWQARQRGLEAFTAETLAENSAMLRVFADVGLPARRRIAGGHGGADLPSARGPGRAPKGQLPGVGGEQGKPGGCGEPASAAAAAVARRGRPEPPSRQHGPGHLAQHRDRRLHRSGLRRQFACPGHGGSALRGVGRRPARAGGPGGDRGAAGRGARSGGAVRPPRGPGPDRHQFRPGRRGRGTEGRLPPVWHAAARAQLFRRDHALDRPGRHLHRRPPGPRGGRR